LIFVHQDLTLQTEKLDLPSISEVQTRGPSEVPFYNHHAAQRPLYVNERLPSLPLPQPQQAYSSSGTSSPRVGSLGSLGSSSILNGSSHSSYTTASSSNGPKTPSPTLAANTGLPLSQAPYHNTPPSSTSYSYNQDSYSNMNHGPQDMYYQSHMSAGQPPAPQTVTSGNMGHYPQHQQQPAK